MRYGGDTFNKQYRVNNYAPEDEEELGKNIDNAALDYILYTSDSNLVNRMWDPITKRYERNGIDIIRRRREADDDYRADTDANHAEAARVIIPANRDGDDADAWGLGGIFDDDLIDGRNSQFYGF